MNVIVCNDTRNAPEPEAFPWKDICDFHAELLNLRNSSFRGLGVNWNSLDPFRLAADIIAERDVSPDAVTLVTTFLDRLVPTTEAARESMNVDRQLCKSIRRRGHTVKLFDGHAINAFEQVWAPLKEPDSAANTLTQMIIEFQAQGAVYDLDYFGNAGFGRGMLINLHNRRALPRDARVIIYSKYLHDDGNSPEEFRKRLPNLNLQFVDRNAMGTTIEDVAAMF